MLPAAAMLWGACCVAQGIVRQAHQLFKKPIPAAMLLFAIEFLLLTFMKYTQATLNRIEKVIEEAGYIIRFERGTFQSGFCILEDRKVVVLNKFLQLEGKINTLIDLMPQLQINTELLSPESKKIYINALSKGQDAANEE